MVRREVWLDAKGRVTRYNLAYVNPLVFAGDNGRVLGYDNAHGFHHRHHYGKVSAIQFESFEAVENAFQSELANLLKEARK